MERKIQQVKGSYMINIPKQLCDGFGWTAGTSLSVEISAVGELRIRKAKI